METLEKNEQQTQESLFEGLEIFGERKRGAQINGHVNIVNSYIALTDKAMDILNMRVGNYLIAGILETPNKRKVLLAKANSSNGRIIRNKPRTSKNNCICATTFGKKKGILGEFYLKEYGVQESTGLKWYICLSKEEFSTISTYI